MLFLLKKSIFAEQQNWHGHILYIMPSSGKVKMWQLKSSIRMSVACICIGTGLLVLVLGVRHIPYLRD